MSEPYPWEEKLEILCLRIQEGTAETRRIAGLRAGCLSEAFESQLYLVNTMHEVFEAAMGVHLDELMQGVARQAHFWHRAAQVGSAIVPDGKSFMLVTGNCIAVMLGEHTRDRLLETWEELREEYEFWRT